MNNPKLLYRIPEKTDCPYTLIVTANNLNRLHILAKFLAELTDKAGLDHKILQHNEPVKLVLIIIAG